jgi:uncharacterized membrane protein YbhN (UPF0104 family)
VLFLPLSRLNVVDNQVDIAALVLVKILVHFNRLVSMVGVLALLFYALFFAKLDHTLFTYLDPLLQDLKS